MTDSAQPFDAVAFPQALSPERRQAIVEAVSETEATACPPAGNSPRGGSPPGSPQLSAPMTAAQSIEQFVRRHGLGGLIDRARGIAERTFVLDSPIEVELVEDAEAGDEWVALSVHTRGEIPEVREAHGRYTREWLSVAPADAATKVRLSISLA